MLSRPSNANASRARGGGACHDSAVPNAAPTLLFVATLAALQACALPGGTVATDEDAIVHGKNAVDGQFPSTFAWTDSADLNQSWCTATKVGPKLFLTAAHCVLSQDDGAGAIYTGPWRAAVHAGATIRYSFAAAPTTAQTATVASVRLPPELAACLANPAAPGPLCDHGRTPLPDVALVELVEAAGAFASAPKGRVDVTPVAANARITLVGYGLSSDTDDGPPRLRFAASSVATSAELTKALAGTEADIDGAPDLGRFFGALGVLTKSTRANIGNGDSGGPVLGPGGAIVGVNSDGFCKKPKRTCQRASNSTFARIDTASKGNVGAWLASQL